MMEKITVFYLHECPYCANARRAVAELIEADPAYGEIPLEWYEETERPDVASGYSYEYVPNFFVRNEKVYEAQPGESYGETKFHIKKAFDAILKEGQ